MDLEIQFIEYIRVFNEILPTFLVSLIVGVLGAYLGSIFTKKWTVRTQKKFLLYELKINKLQEIAVSTSDLSREITSTLGRMISLETGKITPSEFRIKQDQHQENYSKIYRTILINSVFIEEEYSRRIKEIHEVDFNIISNMVYDRYHEEQQSKRQFPEELITFKNIEETIIKCSLKCLSLVDDLNLKIDNELKELKN